MNLDIVGYFTHCFGKLIRHHKGKSLSNMEIASFIRNRKYKIKSLKSGRSHIIHTGFQFA